MFPRPLIALLLKPLNGRVLMGCEEPRSEGSEGAATRACGKSSGNSTAKGEGLGSGVARAGVFILSTRGSPGGVGHQAPPRPLCPDPSLCPETFALQSPHLDGVPLIRWVQPMEAAESPRCLGVTPAPPSVFPPLPLPPAPSLKRSPAKNPRVRLC